MIDAPRISAFKGRSDTLRQMGLGLFNGLIC